jgi:DNA-binding HxlR family transcriptional regulator
MRWKDVGDQTCSIARALAVVGDRWTLLVLREAFGNVRRFEQFQRRTGASRPVLSDRLARLVEHGVLERHGYREHPVRHEYRLTAKGEDLQGVLLALMAWGDRWLDGGDGRPLELVHEACGRVTSARLACDACGAALGRGSVRMRPGPGLRRLGGGAS